MKCISRLLILFLIAGSFTTGFAQSALERVLNIDFGIGTASPKIGLATTGQTANDFWNLYSRDDGRGGYRPDGELTNLKWADGQTSPIGLKVTNAAGAWVTNSRDPMFDTYLYPLSRSGNITVTVSNLPAGQYLFYVYAHGLPDAENAVVEIQSGPQSLGEKSTTTSPGWNTTNWLAGQQFVLFENVVVSPGQPIVVISKPGVSGLAVMNGFQIVKRPELPPACVPTIPGAVAWWRADNDAIDAISANHGALRGGTVFGPGLVGSAFAFNGSTSYVAAPDHDSWAFGSNDFTIEFWVNFRALETSLDIGHPSVIFVANDEGQGTFNKWFFSLGANRLSFHLYSATAGARFLGQAPFSPALNRWYHLSLVRRSDVFAIYQDGALIGSETAAVTVPNANAPLTIGQGEGMSFLNGSMDELAIYRRALSESEIKTIYQAGAAGKCASNQSGSATNDGIPDAWRQQFFGPDFARDSRALANADPDSDGASNYQEFLAGTNPRDRNSVFKLPDFVTTYAGSIEGSNDGFRTEAKFSGIPDLAFDAQGKLWVPEAQVIGYDVPGPGLHRLRVMGTNEVVATFAGAEPGMVDGPASLARFSIPQAFVFNSRGDAFLLERGNHRIRKIDPRGTVSTFAGSTRGDRDGPATNAQFNVPLGLCVDAANNFYVADFFNLKIRKVTANGAVSTFASGSRGQQNGPRAGATFDSPADIVCAKDGRLYVADWSNGMVRKIDTNGVVSTFASGMTYIDRVSLDSAGNVYASGGFGGISKFSPDGKLLWSIKNPPGRQDGPAAQARFTYPGRILERADGNLLVADFFTIRLITLRAPPLLEVQVTPAGANAEVKITLKAIVANATIHYTLDQSAPTLSSPLYTGNRTVPRPAAIQARVFVNNLPISDIVSETLSGVSVPSEDASIVVTTLAGSGSIGAQDGRGSSVTFNFPNAGFVSSSRLSFIADANNHRIRQGDLVSGDVSTIAGAGLAGFQDGPAATALFNVPLGVTVNAVGDIFIADAQNHRIRKISSEGSRTAKTVAGDGTPGYRDGPSPTAQFNFPNDLAFDSAGNLYVSEFNNHTIRKITPDGTVSTFVGNGSIGFANGVGRNAALNAPAGLAIDRAGNLFVTEWQSHRIRKVTRDGTVTVLAGSTEPGFADGFGSAARFKEPDGIALDPLGNLFVTEHCNHAIRKVTPQGQVTTVAGTGVGGFKDGDKSVAQFNGPGGLGWDRTGNLVVADTGNQRVRLVKFLLLPEIASPPQDQFLAVGASAVFQVKATGSGPLAYQWFFKDEPLPGATNATLTLANVQLPNAGKYSVAIGNARGVVASGPVTLTILSRTNFVQRDLPASYSGGSRLTVQLRATPPADATVYAVEESPPAGWVIGDISDGGVYDAVRKKVKFGPFFDRQPRNLTYQVTPPPNETGRREFSGTASVDGESGLIGGDATIDTAPLHPADRNPADFRLAIDEVTAYGTAWRKGTR